jgi:hypothetical protein
MNTDDPSTITSGGDQPQPPQPSPTQPTQPATPTTPTTAVQPADNVTPVRPVRRGGLAGIVDEFRDAVAGTHTSELYHDDEGNAYVRHPTMTHGQQWLKIAAEALRGAGAGMAVGQGPGGKERALAAGVGEADKMAQQQRQNEKDLSEEAKQQNLEKFNAIKLKHDVAAQEFNLQRLKTVATQQDVEFSQHQIDREKQLGSADLGIYKDEADLARVKEANPDFWKHVYDNNVIAVPELNEKGQRQGIHLFLRTPGVGSQLVEQGTAIKVFTPPSKPGEKPTLRDVVPTVPMTHDAVDAYNNAAISQYQNWIGKEGEAAYKQSEVTKNEAEAGKAKAEAAKANAETKKLQSEISDPQTSDALTNDIINGNIVPERIGFLLGKKDGQAFLENVARKAAATGQPFDLSRLQSYPKLYLDYTSGKTSQVLKNLNTAMQHVNELVSLNTLGARIPGTKASSEFKSKLVNVSAEIANALAKPGTTATKDEINKVQNALTPITFRDAAIKKQIESMIDQYKTLRNSWQQGAPSAAYEAKMPDISPEAKEVIRKHAPDQADQWWGQPVTENGKPDGKVLGYSKDGGKTMTPVGGVQ